MKPSKSTSLIFVVLYAMTIPVIAFTRQSKEVCNPLCHNCASVDELASPGVGLDLTLDYGTAAIKYENGTIIDVGKVNGSEEYKAMMQHFIMINQQQIDQFNHLQSLYTQFSLKFPQWVMRKYSSFAPRRDLPSSKAVNALTNMLQQLNALVIKHLSSSSDPHDFINPLPLPSHLRNSLHEDEKIFPYSVHIAMRNSETISDENIESALQAAGLSNPGFYMYGRSYKAVIRARPSSFTAPDFATFIDISNSSTSLFKDSKVILAVEYTASALSLNIFTYDRYKNIDLPDEIDDWTGSVIRPDLGADVAGKLAADDLQTYYEDVEKFVNNTIKQQLPNFQEYLWAHKDTPGVDALLMLGDQSLSQKISLLEPLRKSLGFNDTIASTLRRLDRMDTLYEGARDAASKAKKVSEEWYRFPSKRTCPDDEILRYYRERFEIDWDFEVEIANTSEPITPDAKGNEEEMSEALPKAGAEEGGSAEVIDSANFVDEPLEEMVSQKGDVKTEAEGYLMAQDELKV